jgi:hypothetical protein
MYTGQVHRLSQPKLIVCLSLWDWCISVCMTSAYHLPHPPSVWESSVSSTFTSSSFITPTPSLLPSSPPSFHFIRSNNLNLQTGTSLFLVSHNTTLSHYTDTHIYIYKYSLYLSFCLFIIHKKSSYWFRYSYDIWNNLSSLSSPV